MKDLMQKIAANTSPAEAAKIKDGCFVTAEWIVSKVIPNLTPTQIESVAFRFVDYAKNN